MRAAERFELEKPTRRLLKQLADGKLSSKKVSETRGLPSPAMHSEEGKLGFLRTTWADDAPRLTVSYADNSTFVELMCENELLWSGLWQLHVQFDGEPRAIVGNWETVCWYSDKDVDFLEIEASLGDGLQAERQFLLSRKDDVLLIADAVISNRKGRIEYQSSLPITTRVGFQGADETRARDISSETVLASWRYHLHCQNGAVKHVLAIWRSLVTALCFASLAKAQPSMPHCSST